MANKFTPSFFVTFFLAISIFSLNTLAIEQKIIEECNFNKGSSYIKINNGKAILVKHFNYYRPGAWFSNIKISPGKSYKLTYSVRGKTPRRNAYYLRIKLSGNKDKLYSIPQDIISDKFKSDEFVFKAPNTLKNKNIEIQLFARVTGDGVIYKDLKLTEIPAISKCELKITCPAYRNTIYHSKPVKNIIGYVSAPENIKKVIINLYKENELINSQKGRRFVFKGVEKFANGNYQIVAKLFNRQNNEIKTLKTSVKKLPPGKLEVVAGQDNSFYINGKLFCPIFFSSFNSKSLKLRYYAASKGVNLFVVTDKNHQDLKKNLDDAKKYNYKLILNTSYHGTANPSAIKSWLTKLSGIIKPDILEHPALFGYILKDEPAVKGEPLRPLISAYSALKRFDPYRPVWINAAPHETIALHKEYSKASDIYGTDVYPVGRWNHGAIGNVKSLTCVGSATNFFVNAVEKQKPIWFYLQAYAWKKDWNTPSQAIYPNLTQSRFMFYDSLFNGANGFGYFGVKSICRESFVNILFKMTNEIHKMSRLITNGKIINAKTYGNIHTRLFKYNNRLYLIAINYSEIPCSTTLDFQHANTVCNVLFEKRKLSIKDKKVTDNFSAFDVHIYATDSLPEPLMKSVVYKGSDNPWLKFIRDNKKIKRVTQHLNWIWARNETRANSKVWLARQIVIRKAVKKAVLVITADNKANVYIDKKKIATTRSWNKAIKINVTSYLSLGEHFLKVYARDIKGLPCGLLAYLKIEYNNGTVQNIYSDDSWYGIKACSPTIPEKSDIKTWWGQAEIIAPYGKGRWKNRVKNINNY
jgi:hypothetical protein